MKTMFVSYSCPRTDCKINVSLSDLHGPSVVSSILLYYTSLPLWTYTYFTKASILSKAPFYSRCTRRGHPCPVPKYIKTATLGLRNCF